MDKTSEKVKTNSGTNENPAKNVKTNSLPIKVEYAEEKSTNNSNK